MLSVPGRPEMERRKSSTPHYTTFPTVKPPRNRGRPPPLMSSESSSGFDGDQNGNGPSNGGGGDGTHEHHLTPLPRKQLAMLAVIALTEQTALNSLSPYLPEMTSTFPEVNVGQIGLYVGCIASSFALAQFATGFFWGWLSDRIGRKPVVMIGTLLSAGAFLMFGFCRTLWQAILVQAFMGLVNGNQGVISTCLGEITDRSNQSEAFVYLPVLYGLGGITGPAIGGLLVFKDNPFRPGQANPYPYLAPNLFAASILIIDLILTAFFLEESLEEAKDLPPLKERVGNLFAWMWQFAGGSRNPTYARRHHHNSRHRVDGADTDEETDNDSENQSLLSLPGFLNTDSTLLKGDVLKRDTIVLLCTYLVFQLSNISYNTLYPVFAAGQEPTGRNLSPEVIGISLAFAGVVAIVFQIALFGKLKEKMGNKATYRAGLFLLFLSMILMPFVGHRGDKPLFGVGSGTSWLWVELGFVLLIKTVASVGGLTSALLLITNSAPNHSVLGTLNGLAQTLSAAGRAIGPFVSGGLFTLGVKLPKGEALAWGVFGGVAFLGFVASFGIRGEELESAEWDEEEGNEEGSGSDERGSYRDEEEEDARVGM